MTWVRGHYRRTSSGFVRVRGHSRTSPAGALATIALAVGVALVYGIYVVVKGVVDFVGENALAFAVGGSIVVGVTLAVLVWWQVAARARRKRLLAFVVGANAALDSPRNQELWRRVEKLRRAAGDLPEHIIAQTSPLYSMLVAAVVDDGRVDADELASLAAAEHALGLTPEGAAAARREGFLTVFRVAVADGRLTKEDEQSLARLRDGLGVAPASVEAHLGAARELVQARAVADSTPDEVSPPVKLQKGERCFYFETATEVKRTRGRSSSGQAAWQPVRSGTLCVTDRRLLFAGAGTTSVKHEVVLDATVHPEDGILVIVKDGRNAPYYFCMEKPRLAVAHVRRAARLGTTRSDPASRQP